MRNTGRLSANQSNLNDIQWYYLKIALILQLIYLICMVCWIKTDMMLKHFNKSIDDGFAEFDTIQYGYRSEHSILQSLKI